MIEKLKQYKKEIILCSITFIITLIICVIGFNIASSSNNKSSKSTSAKTTYVASKNSDKYHKTSCKWAENIKPSNKITFSSTERAEAKGYSPCRTCKP